ncbi:MAG: hypothetical protein GTN62_02125 [Gemmatimonadales bacterium]|nr:hypothetical protein [Gemmatimonadales bacterium]NIN12361.1 hypothetical protein [Gemmatimonadales bacterium]NIN48899.1 hypothetical protein [Gemmatimonadales bacterium]NIP06363.1 hypothetical protein [Gemmatimonadales bacterium]NIR00736.1 hypothetical protein [Gemmatimonadales bacterium]
MNQQMGLTEFFAMEASEYLERLDVLLSGAPTPNAKEFVSLTRSLRGSALMAKQSAIATAAAAFENFARSVRDKHRPWDEATRQMAIRAVDEFKILVRQVGNWTDVEQAKAEKLALDLDPEGRRTPGPRPAPAAMALDTGTRAFIGREGAAVGSALDQAAKSLQQNPRGYDPLQRVLNVMQPLRGLALLSELPAMPDLLDGVEQAIAEITRQPEPTEGAALLFNAAAKALSRAAQEVATTGTADPDSPEMQDFAHRLGAIVDLGTDVVTVQSLYFDDAGPHVVQQGTAPARPGELGRLELVSHGEHLRQAADQLERARAKPQRELRAQALAGTFRALSSGGGGLLQDAVSQFAAAASEAIARGAAVHQTDAFATQLREAGAVLAGTGEEDMQSSAGRLAGIVVSLRQLPGASAAAAPVAEGPLHRPPAESVAAAAPSPPAPPTPLVEGGEIGEETPDLVGSWARFQRYVDALGLGEPSLEELLAGPPADPMVPAAAPVPSPPVEAAVAEEAIVPITHLCYSGGAALERALTLRDQIRAALRSDQVNGSDLNDLIEEVFDLVELSRQ